MFKRYLAFAGSDYYPCKGFGDFLGDFDELTTATDLVYKLLLADRFGWGQIVDTQTRSIVVKAEYVHNAPPNIESTNIPVVGYMGK